MWQFITDNKEIIAVTATVLTGCLGVLAAVLNRKRIIVHKIESDAAKKLAIPGLDVPQPPVSPKPANSTSVAADAKLPQVILIPARPAVRSDAHTTLDVLVRILPPAQDKLIKRPPLNLGLILDRSGSMAGSNKIEFTRQAAIYTVEQLLPSDRVSVTVFDNTVETIVPNTKAVNKASIIQLLKQIQPGGSTALHTALMEGCRQVNQFKLRDGLNRVMLLSDGLANVGETNADAIASDVKRWSQQGIGSTALGVGTDYNEDLLEAIALSGDGNYYYIETPAQIESMFQTELHGLVGTVGTKVSLGVEPASGVTVVDVLNDLDRTEFGRWKLSNLITRMPIEVIVRLDVPVWTGGELCRFRLAWNAPQQEERQAITATLVLPGVPSNEWHGLARQPEVEERSVLLAIARLKKQAACQVEKGDRDGAARAVDAAKEMLAPLPTSPQKEQEQQALAKIKANVEQGEWQMFTKEAKYQRYWRTLNRPS
jgi:Ca-activated chloride channel family protein